MGKGKSAMFESLKKLFEAREEVPDDFQREEGCLYAGDKVWVEFPPEWDSWDGKPTHAPGVLVAVDVETQTGLVLYENAGNLIAHWWFSAERLSERSQLKPFDERVTATAVAIAA